MLNWLFPKRKPREPWQNEDVLFHLSKKDPFCLRDAFEGVCVFGGIGSGKTSGSGRVLAQSYLRAGFGLLVLVTKPDERELWVDYCKRTGRLNDLRIFSSDSEFRFNTLDYECRHGGKGAGLTQNVVGLLEEILTMADGREQGAGSGHDDAYWSSARKQLLWNCTDLLKLAGETISVPNLYALITSIARHPDELSDDAWQKRSYCFQLVARLNDLARSGRLSETDRGDGARSVRFLLSEYPNLASKTRSIVDSTFSSAASLLDRGLLRTLFSTTTNLTPLDVLDGKVIIVDLPFDTYALAGLFAGVLWKRSYQLTTSRRLVNGTSRPVALFIDEAQTYTTPSDATYMATCRSKRAGNVYLSQNINNYFVTLGGTEKAQAQTQTILANLSTVIGHANSCPRTGEYISTRIGRTLQFFANFSQSRQRTDWFGAITGRDDNVTDSGGFSESYEFDLQPSVFGQLRSGGVRHRGMVDAVIFKAGHQFRATGKNWLITTFQQAR